MILLTEATAIREVPIGSAGGTSLTVAITVDDSQGTVSALKYTLNSGTADLVVDDGTRMIPLSKGSFWVPVANVVNRGIGFRWSST